MTLRKARKSVGVVVVSQPTGCDTTSKKFYPVFMHAVC